jgi:hypothetical protein
MLNAEISSFHGFIFRTLKSQLTVPLNNTLQTGALLLDGNTLNYFGSSIPINLIVAVAAEVVLVGGAEYYRITNGLVSNKST